MAQDHSASQGVCQSFYHVWREAILRGSDRCSGSSRPAPRATAPPGGRPPITRNCHTKKTHPLGSKNGAPHQPHVVGMGSDSAKIKPRLRVPNQEPNPKPRRFDPSKGGGGGEKRRSGTTKSRHWNGVLIKSIFFSGRLSNPPRPPIDPPGTVRSGLFRGSGSRGGSDLSALLSAHHDHGRGRCQSIPVWLWGSKGFEWGGGIKMGWGSVRLWKCL